jgi:hypothetical protein
MPGFLASLCVCMHACMWLGVCVCVHVRAHVYVYVYVYVYVSVSVYVIVSWSGIVSVCANESVHI